MFADLDTANKRIRNLTADGQESKARVSDHGRMEFRLPNSILGFKLR